MVHTGNIACFAYATPGTPRALLPGMKTTTNKETETMTNLSTTYHPATDMDPSVTYWSVYRQVWVRQATHVPAAELAAMGAEERAAVTAHLAGNDW